MPLSLLSLWSWLASLSSGAWWSYGSAFIVLVGVVGETITELTDWIKPEDRRKRVAKVSAIVLIIGLTGDLLGIRETQIEVASLTKEAGDAKKSAEGAAAAAFSARASADSALQDEKQLRADLDKAIADEKKAETALALEQRKTAKAQKAAADAQRQLNEFLMSRAFPRQLKNDLRALLKELPPARAEILFKDTDGEARFFADTIQAALSGAGWSVPPITPVPEAKFNGKDFGFWGVRVFDNKHDAVFTGSPSIELAGAGMGLKGESESDVRRLAVLLAAVSADGISIDPSLPNDSFKIVISARGPFR
jgi:hypothetical protein